MPELAEWQKRNGYPFSLLTEASVNLADDEELLEDMRTAGFRRVFVGIETPVEESLKEAQKSQNRGNLLDSVKKIQSYGMEVMAGFIVGFDNDPEDIFERQINFHSRERDSAGDGRTAQCACRTRNCGGGSSARAACWALSFRKQHRLLVELQDCDGSGKAD